MRHSRGFGVQSPWAYRMVRYVINEHWPYYAYAELAVAYPDVDAEERRLCELAFRLSNHLQPQSVAAYGDVPDALGAYVKAGCRRSDYVKADCPTLNGSTSEARFVVIAPCKDAGAAFYGFNKTATDGSAVMLLGICRDKSMRTLWRKIVAETDGIVTFDLYYCGLVFFDSKRFTQNYKINF